MSLLIRAAGPDDIPAMSAVLLASIIELCGDDHHQDPRSIAAWTANKNPAGVAAMLANPDLRMFVAELAGQVQAVGAVHRDGTISLNYVAPAARFSGISSALLTRLEAELAALGHRNAQLESTSTARAFYESRGWRSDGPQASGRVVNGYPMRKILDGAEYPS